MENDEQLEFARAMAEAEDLIHRAQAALQRAKWNCHGDVYMHADVLSKRVYELRVRSAWLRYAVSGAIDSAPDAGHERGSTDRRSATDRRVGGMRRQVLAIARLNLASPA